MRIAISGGELPDGTSLDDLVAICLACGASGVEMWYPKNFDRPLGETLAVLERARIAVSAVSSATEMGREGSVEADEAILSDALHTAAALKAPFCNSYFGYRRERDDAKAAAAYAASAERLLRKADRLRVVMLVENESDAFGNDPVGSDPTRRPSGIAHLMSAPQHRLGLTLDPCNALFSGNDPVAFTREVGRFAKYLHVKDGRRLPPGEGADPPWRDFRDEDRRYATCRFGEGDVDWSGVLRSLRDVGFDGWATLEPHCAYVALEGELIVAASRFSKMLKEVFA